MPDIQVVQVTQLDTVVEPGPIEVIQLPNATVTVATTTACSVVSQTSTEINTVSVGVQGPPGIGLNPNYLQKSADYFVDINHDFFVGVDCSNGNVNIHLPVSNSNNQGDYVTIKKIDSTGYMVVVQTSNGQTIDNTSPTFDILFQYDAFIFTSTGSGYFVS